MNKKMFNILYVLLLFIFIINFRVYAQTNKTCDSTTKKQLKELISQISVDYELKAVVNTYEDVEKLPSGATPKDYGYKIIISNATDDFYYKIGSYFKTYKDAKDGVIVFDKTSFSGGARLKLEIIASSKNKCSGTKLRTIVIRLPYYNVYSVYPECEGKNNLYSLCAMSTNTSRLTPEQFREQLKKEEETYKERQEAKKPVEENKKWYEEVINWFKENAKLAITIVVSFIILVILIVIKVKIDNKNRIKVDLGDL